MKINVMVTNKDGLPKKTKIESSNLDSKLHKHVSGREFTADEVKTLKGPKEVKASK